MAIAAAVPPVVAEDHGRELGVHGDIVLVFVFVLCETARFLDLQYQCCAWLKIATDFI